MQRDPFAHEVYHVRRTRETGADGKHWLFTLHDAEGGLLLKARFPEIPGEVTLLTPGHPEIPLVRLKAWRWFWWNGRYDVVEEDTGAVLATLRRTGGIEGPDRRALGRVRTAMPVRKALNQWFFIGLLDLLFSGGGDVSTLSMDCFRVEAGEVTVGILRRVRLPFLMKEDPAVAVGRGGVRRWLDRMRAALARGQGAGGWELDFSAVSTGSLDPRVRLAAALLRIQIEDRYH